MLRKVYRAAAEKLPDIHPGTAEKLPDYHPGKAVKLPDYHPGKASASHGKKQVHLLPS